MEDLEEQNSLIANEVILDRCSNWVESQKNCIYIKEDFQKPDELEYDDWCITDSEFDSVSECGGKKRKVRTQLNNEVLDLVCEWKECTFRSNHLDQFLRHVSSHIPNIQISIKDDNEVYVCQWKDCPYNIDVGDEIIRHVNYHAYHTKLKCIGSNVRAKIKLPKCHRDAEWKNILDSPPPHLCRWEECLKSFTNYQMYLYHVTVHLTNYPRSNKVKNGIDCKWIGCNGKYFSWYKLRDHLRCHTKEKIVACPDCGVTFASNTKFHIHCQRQIPLEVQGFRCSHCNKFYPTEGILRDHMRSHVFNYKCTLCDMSCESPSGLAKHVRYRHMSTRTYPCQLCSHAAKSQQDLDTHMTVHTNGPNFSCYFEGCLYTCKGAYILDRHLERVHSLAVRWYCCHECPIKYRTSSRLTKHLVEAHQLQLPSGHKRFHYTQEEDGCYRIQKVRYEAVDEENMVPVEEADLPDKKFKIELNQTTSLTAVKIIEDNVEEEMEAAQDSQKETEENDADKIVPVISNILISIDDIDEKGNIIKQEIVEIQEMKELPSEKPLLILT
ncbi:PREDICTED: histone H4 transcription factor [Cyphomyrmex costatus]|uniref:histone H4 transcription factor n=1 Tax=Cyphomyrmex costatus TaxID=456900 RepID=UPI00085231AC|nr:PREDICTED: histone H4 transcription factor [Cyphomyrmex costatus]